MKNTIICFYLFILILSFQSYVSPQQSKLKIEKYIRMIEKGNLEQVKSQLQSLRNTYPSDPSIFYLEGLVETDEGKSIKYFQIISDSFPNSEWADDALVRLAEIYSRAGKIEPMNQILNRLKNEYPKSYYIKTNYISKLENSSTDQSYKIPLNKLAAEYTIQVGAFSKITNAKRLQQKLKIDGYNTDIYENLLDGKNLLYLLWVGTYNSKEEAIPDLKKIKAKYKIKGVIRTRCAWKKW